MQNINLVSLPWGGELVTLSCQGRYAGWGRNKLENVKLVSGASDNEKFIIELDGNLYAFKQQVSNLYIGGDIVQGTHMVFVPAKKSAQHFYLQPTFNGNVRIKSMKNTYLCVSGELLTWKTNPNNPDECSWKINILQGSHKMNHQQMLKQSQSGFLKDGSTIIIANKFGVIGNHKGVYENLEVVKDSSINQQFKIIRLNDGRAGIKQTISGLFIGHNASDGDKLLLAPCFQGHEKFVLESQGDNRFVMINCKSLYVGLKGNNLVLKSKMDESCVWEYYQEEKPVQLPQFSIGLARITQQVKQ